jgi:ribonuclease-3 family protein
MDRLKIEKSRRPEEMPALALAYIGDAVWEVFVRQHLLALGELRPYRLQKAAVNYVKAKAQADILHHLMNGLTEEEMAVMRRGRNAKSGTVPKNADVVDYRHSTGFESLVGYLYLKEEFDRLQALALQAIWFVDQQQRRE